MTGPDIPALVTGQSPCRRAAMNGAIWGLPILAAILEMSLSIYSETVSAYTAAWPKEYLQLLLFVFLGGSSLCLFIGLLSTENPSGPGGALKQGVFSGLPVAAGYLLFALLVIAGTSDGKEIVWGAGFGAASASGSVVAAAAGGLLKLGAQALRGAVSSARGFQPPAEKQPRL